jgi:hypothetical protein
MAVASAPNVVSARIATKATVLLRGPIMTLLNEVSQGGRTIHAGNMAKKFLGTVIVETDTLSAA